MKALRVKQGATTPGQGAAALRSVAESGFVPGLGDTAPANDRTPEYQTPEEFLKAYKGRPLAQQAHMLALLAWKMVRLTQAKVEALESEVEALKRQLPKES